MDLISSSRMTKYERARILGTRAHHISMNAPILIDRQNEINPLTIAEMELAANKLPIILCRIHPNGIIEEINVSDLTPIPNESTRLWHLKSYD